jgi:hypothetical protein
MHPHGAGSQEAKGEGMGERGYTPKPALQRLTGRLGWP